MYNNIQLYTKKSRNIVFFQSPMGSVHEKSGKENACVGFNFLLLA